MGQKLTDTNNAHTLKSHRLDATTNSELAEGSLRNHFLIAMPSLTESSFAHSIVYVCEHNADGALGFVINQVLDIELDEIFEQLELPRTPDSRDQTVLCGGPLQPENGFILHTSDKVYDSSIKVSDDIHLTASKNILTDMAIDNGPNKTVVALGYAGWSSGQLEAEIAENAWLTVPADPSIIFDIPCEQRWSSISNYLGIDLNLIHSTAGHA